MRAAGARGRLALAPRLAARGRRAAALVVAVGAGCSRCRSPRARRRPPGGTTRLAPVRDRRDGHASTGTTHYGPLDWPRDGHHAAEHQARTPLYWKASVLDRFDGFGWQRALRRRPARRRRASRRAAAADGRARATSHPEWVTPMRLRRRARSSSDARDRRPGSTDAIRRARRDPDRSARRHAHPRRRAARAAATEYSVVAVRARSRRPPSCATRRPPAPGAPIRRRRPCSRCRRDSGVTQRPDHAERDAALGAARPGDDRPGARLAVRPRLPPRAAAGSPTRGRRTTPSARSRTTSQRLRLRPERPAAHLPAGVVPVRRPVRLLPAVLRRDGPDAADARDPGRVVAGFAPGR